MSDPSSISASVMAAGCSCRVRLLLVAALLVCRTIAADPELTFLGDRPAQFHNSKAFGVSANGDFVVGSRSIDFVRTEGFVWSSAEGMLGLGSVTGSEFNTQAVDASADGRFIIGTRLNRNTSTLEAVRWSRSPALGITIITPGYAKAISNAGDLVVGEANIGGGALQGYRWTAAGGRVLINGTQSAGAVSGDGRIIAGSTIAGNVYRLINGTTFQDLGRLSLVPAASALFPTGVTTSGADIAGVYQQQFTQGGVFAWKEAREPPFTSVRTNTAGDFGADRTFKVGISADGRTVLEDTGRIYIDGRGPFSLRDLLLDYGIDVPAFMENFLGGPASRAEALSDDGLTIVGHSTVGSPSDFVVQAWRVRFQDSDQNGVADEVEVFACGLKNKAFLAEIEKGSTTFAAQRETLGYGGMIPQYGQPWKPGSGRIPGKDPTQPAEHLRAIAAFAGCPDGSAINNAEVVRTFLSDVAFPAVREIHSFEMLLGNEARADALDPTIGLDGLEGLDVNGEFAFKGTGGIEDLIDEELALLRGRELPGEPADWVDDAIYFPEFANPEAPLEKRRVAVYNRLPPNAGEAAGPAYRSNYKAADNFIAAGKFPQGHGDAYGHYLTAVSAGIKLLRDAPDGLPENELDQVSVIATGTDLGLETVRRIAEAGAARAQSAAQIADLLYRRDYRESSTGPRTDDLFNDSDVERAWSMGDWTRRGAMGAYFDYATASHWAPTDEARALHRGSFLELGELAESVSALQERLDSAGARLDPLGLVQNVVPFGIDASGLGTSNGRSHFEQVFDAATRAVANARKAFESANLASQRLRDSDKAFNDFRERLADTRADQDQQLIEIFGLASPDDPEDNDLDPLTNNTVESESRPDLVRFLDDDEALARRGMRPRAAPGQVQLALSELRVATLRLEQAELAIEDLAEQVKDQLALIETIESIQVERIEIIARAAADQIKLTQRLKELSELKKNAALLGGMFNAFAGAVVGSPQGGLSLLAQVANNIGEALVKDGGSLEDEFDVEKERTRIQAWKEIELQELENKLRIQQEATQLKALLRRTPQLVVDRSVAREVAVQALGRLQQSIVRGKLIVKERQRLEARTQEDQLDERWKDMSFRVFRNAALKNYRAFFDIAARYVVLAGRAFAYEFDARSTGEDLLAGIYRERRLGVQLNAETGLQGVLNRLENAGAISKFNQPLESLDEARSFSFRRNMLGIGAESIADDLRFRAFLESQIVERVEDLPEIRDLAQVSVERDYGPGIVITFASEINGRNFFGRGPELPFGNSNYSMTHNIKIRNYAIRLDGVNAALGTDPESGIVFVYLIPVGDSVLREQTNKPRIEDELVTPWAVVDQFLPLPPVVSTADFSRRTFNAWRSTAQVSGNFLNEIKRQRDSEAQIEQGQPKRFNTNLAGRSAWNTRWLLVIPGSQWTSSSSPGEIRRMLLQFIYGPTGGPTGNPFTETGITDIRLFIQAYSH